MATLPATGFGPRPVVDIPAQLRGQESRVWQQTRRFYTMPAAQNPVPVSSDMPLPETGGAPLTGQPQGRTGDHSIPPEVIAGGLGALRAILGREAFNAFLRNLAFVTVGPATAANAALWAGGWVFDPVRWVYQQGIGFVIPGPPVRPVQGLLTPQTTDILARLYGVFDSDLVDSTRRLKLQNLRAWFEGLVASGRLSLDDPQVADFERRFGLTIRPPGWAVEEEEFRRRVAIALYLTLNASRLFGEAGESGTPATPAGSVDP